MYEYERNHAFLRGWVWVMDVFWEWFPFLIPVIVIELGLAIAALVHVLRHPTYRFGNRLMWVLIVLLINIIGPVVYFVIGRGEE